ncbi:MAG: zinc-binding dehydrogenase [Alphaproteobacteria bacterium]|nr:zinc-binding dehydrogenase [Alphaproteobacteria bacterium]MBL7097675.1 zinc-binding dehydrogenase [Alphaproteobacteria bacterium]
MKAAILNAFGAPLEIQTLPDPVLGTGEVIVDMAAAGVAGYTAGVLSGARSYVLELPIAPGPGGIGRVRATGPDATKLKPGDWVYVDATIRSRDDAINPDSILLGWTARTPAAMRLHRFYHHGSFAEQLLVPTDNVTPIGAIGTKDAGRWTAISRLLVPYGGLLAGDLKAGETILVNGATGGFGGAGVAVALAMGAATVIAAGRNANALSELVRRHGPRVKPAQMTGVEADDRARILETAGAPIDFVLDFLPREARPSQVQSAIMSARPGGRVVLMGGVRGDLALNYNWIMHNNVVLRGQWMYDRTAVPRLIQMVRAGLIDLDKYDLTEFALAQANEAVAHAAANAGPHRLTALRPDR